MCIAYPFARCHVWSCGYCIGNYRDCMLLQVVISVCTVYSHTCHVLCDCATHSSWGIWCDAPLLCGHIRGPIHMYLALYRAIVIFVCYFSMIREKFCFTFSMICRYYEYEIQKVGGATNTPTRDNHYMKGE